MSTRTGVRLAVTLLAALSRNAAAQLPDSAMAGEWRGEATLSADWLLATALPVRLTIAPDGSVRGTVGDAALIDARLSPNRGIVESALRIGRVHLVSGRLEGPIIRREGQQRAGVRLMLDWRGGTFVGELETSGEYEGSPQEMRIRGSGLTLRRVPAERADRAPVRDRPRPRRHG